MTEDEKVAQISKILAAWNPLANDQAAAIGLSDYEVEAEDTTEARKSRGESETLWSTRSVCYLLSR